MTMMLMMRIMTMMKNLDGLRDVLHPLDFLGVVRRGHLSSRMTNMDPDNEHDHDT